MWGPLLFRLAGTLAEYEGELCGMGFGSDGVVWAWDLGVMAWSGHGSWECRQLVCVVWGKGIRNAFLWGM